VCDAGLKHETASQAAIRSQRKKGTKTMSLTDPFERNRRPIRTSRGKGCRGCVSGAGLLAIVLVAGLASGAAAADRAGARVAKSRPFLKVVEATCSDSYCDARVVRLRNNRRLHIENVSCRIQSSADAQARYAALYAALPDSRADVDYFVPRVISGAAASETRSFNHETTYHAFPKQRVYVEAQFEDGSLDAMTCKVAGELQILK
jgi:hypothetical protein